MVRRPLDRQEHVKAQALRSPDVWLAVISVGLIVGAGIAGGQQGLAGLFLGIVGTSVSMLGTWLGVRWVGKVLADDSPRWQGAVVPVAAVVIKLPLIVGAMLWAQRLGGAAPSWFLAGLALVYSATVKWALSRQ
ncbi:MAG: hypothetical protein JSS66_14890 [Armatimonadetes bacterium]|nr:hypothetical protein [Armatimonadota bacterium]